MKYEAVIFDLFGTLVRNFPLSESHDVLRRMAAELSVPADDFIEKWDEAFPERMTGELRNYQECIGHICRRMGAPASDEKIELAADIRFEMTTREVAVPRDGAVEVLSALREKGCKTGLLSDCATELTLLWNDLPFASLIDAPVFSCVEGIKKPDHRFFMIPVDRLAVRPENCIYVADGIGQELHGAAGLGMHAVQILVPGEDNYDRYRGEWNGPVISSLREVLRFVEAE